MEMVVNSLSSEPPGAGRQSPLILAFLAEKKHAVNINLARQFF